MSTRVLCVPRSTGDDGVEGSFLGDDAFDFLINEDCDCYTVDGRPLFKFRKAVIPEPMTAVAAMALRAAAAVTNNRGAAGGEVDEFLSLAKDKRTVGAKSRFRYRPVKKSDGTLSRTSYGNPVNSGVVGFYNRYPRIPYCRQTSYALNNPEKFGAVYPWAQAIDRVFAKEMPERHRNQMQVVAATHPDFVISGTAFTTITVNRNWQTAVHKDAGDLQEGFGVLAVVARDGYTGGYYAFAQYRVAVDMYPGDVILADVHEWHGNTTFHPSARNWERLSTVLYYRQGMRECGSAAEELSRAKKLRGAL